MAGRRDGGAGGSGGSIATQQPGTFTATTAASGTATFDLSDSGFLTELTLRVDGDIAGAAITGGPVQIEAWLKRGPENARQLCSGSIHDELSMRGSGQLPITQGNQIVLRWVNTTAASVIVRVDASVDPDARGDSAPGWRDETCPFVNWDSVASEPFPTNPAAGADFTYTIPAGYIARLDLLATLLDTDANAANRTLHFGIFNGAIEIMRWPVAANFANETANQVDEYVLGVGMPSSDAADQDSRSYPLTDHLELQAGLIIKTVTALIQVGDQHEISWILKLRPIQ